MPENDLRILNWLLTSNPESVPETFASVVHWKKQHEKALLAWSEPVDMAIAGGFLSGCPAYAFAGGYWAALYRLLPALPKASVPALCISEKGGVHPANIKCRLEKSASRWLLNGKKHFITCGREAELLLALLLSVRTIARADFTAPEIHIATGGAIAALQLLLAAVWKQFV